MNRRDFMIATPLLVVGCGTEIEEMPREFELQQSPRRSYTQENIPSFYKGSWTPTLNGNADFTLPPVGTFVRIADLCFIHCWLWISNINTTNQNLIFGLPFKSRAVLNGGHENVLSVISQGNLATQVEDIAGIVSENETAPAEVARDTCITLLALTKVQTDGAHSEVNLMTDACILHITGWYEVVDD